jgi:hypothetical protein
MEEFRVGSSEGQAPDAVERPAVSPPAAGSTIIRKEYTENCRGMINKHSLFLYIPLFKGV